MGSNSPSPQVISVDLAKQLLENRPGSRALVISMEFLGGRFLGCSRGGKSPFVVKRWRLYPVETTEMGEREKKPCGPTFQHLLKIRLEVSSPTPKVTGRMCESTKEEGTMFNGTVV